LGCAGEPEKSIETPFVQYYQEATLRSIHFILKARETNNINSNILALDVTIKNKIKTNNYTHINKEVNGESRNCSAMKSSLSATSVKS
jgi:hypothetical protein